MNFRSADRGAMLILGLSMLILPASATLWSAEPPARYTAVMANGARLTGKVLAQIPPAGGWQLDQQPLFDPTNPCRWLRHRILLPGAPPSAFVELVTGDRLTGVVVGHREGGTTPFDPEPPHFVVQPDTRLAAPQPMREPTVRVVARFVRRIVWQRRASTQYQPATVFYRDGRSVPFRAIRFGESGISLLTADGQRKADYGELAELHLPVTDFWDQYFDELAGLCPRGPGRLVQLETIDGALVTTSQERLRLHAPGGPQDSWRWVHGAHPAWSLDTLWLPQSSVWMIRSWESHEVPLSRVWPSEVKQRGWLTAQAAPHRINRNVQQGLLRTGGMEHGWGFGVQASSQITFPLPSCAATFHSRVGLDRLVGAGGCIRARVLTDGKANPSFDSGFLVGSEILSDTGIIAFEHRPQGNQLILDVDSAHDGRPPGADPFDIRDLVDWVDPLIQLDSARLAPEIASRVPRHIPAWQGWQVQIRPRADSAGPLAHAWMLIWDDLAPSPGRFLLTTAPKQGDVVLEQTMTVGAADEWFLVAVAHAAAVNPPAKAEVSFDDEPVAEAPVAVRNTSVRDPAPLVVPLELYRGRELRVRVVLTAPPNAPAAPVWWRVARAMPQLPTLYRVFEESWPRTATARENPPTADQPRVTADDRLTGVRSLEVQPERPASLELTSPVAIRDQPAWGEYRYVRLAVRKEGEGRFVVEFAPSELREQAMRLDGGQGDPVAGAAVRIYQAKLPDQWLPLTHDLFASFGKVDVTGVTLSAPDGARVRFDSVYFGRTPADFEFIPQWAPLPPLPATVRDESLRVAPGAAGPALVRVELGDGKSAGGVVISADGDVLLPARHSVAPNQPVKVRLPDGRVVAGQSRGAARTLDIALVKITDAGPWPVGQILPTPVLPADAPYVQVLPAQESSLVPPARIVRPQRQFRSTVWTPAPEGNDFGPGLALLDAAGRIAGLASRTHGGGLLYVRLHEVPPALPRLRAGEVW